MGVPPEIRAAASPELGALFREWQALLHAGDVGASLNRIRKCVEELGRALRRVGVSAYGDAPQAWVDGLGRKGIPPSFVKPLDGLGAAGNMGSHSNPHVEILDPGTQFAVLCQCVNGMYQWLKEPLVDALYHEFHGVPDHPRAAELFDELCKAGLAEAAADPLLEYARRVLSKGFHWKRFSEAPAHRRTLLVLRELARLANSATCHHVGRAAAALCDEFEHDTPGPIRRWLTGFEAAVHAAGRPEHPFQALAVEIEREDGSLHIGDISYIGYRPDGEALRVVAKAPRTPFRDPLELHRLLKPLMNILREKMLAQGHPDWSRFALVLDVPMDLAYSRFADSPNEQGIPFSSIFLAVLVRPEIPDRNPVALAPTVDDPRASHSANALLVDAPATHLDIVERRFDTEATSLFASSCAIDGASPVECPVLRAFSEFAFAFLVNEPGLFPALDRLYAHATSHPPRRLLTELRALRKEIGVTVLWDDHAARPHVPGADY